jgi:hypothetical protein
MISVPAAGLFDAGNLQQPDKKMNDLIVLYCVQSARILPARDTLPFQQHCMSQQIRMRRHANARNRA